MPAGHILMQFYISQSHRVMYYLKIIDAYWLDIVYVIGAVIITDYVAK